MLESAIAIRKQSLRDVIASLKNIALNSGALAEGTNANTIKTTAAINYMIDGVFCQLGITDNIAMTPCAIQAAGRRCRYLISVNAAGTVTITKGTEVIPLSTGALTTISWDAVQKRLCESGGSLAFNPGDVINVSGFTNVENNGLFTVEVVDPEGKWLQVRENSMVDETAGAAITVIRESLLPDLPNKNAAIGILTLVTGAATFTVGTQDLTGDIGTGSASFTNIGLVPTQLT